MALKNPDILEHNNPNLAAADADFVRGGPRSPVANLTALYALSAKSDQLKAYSTRVWVVSLSKFMMLVDINNVGNSTGWLDVGGLTTLSVERQVADIAARNLLPTTGNPTLQDQENVYVVNATGDPTVSSGWALYKWLSSGATWLKISEGESIDVDFSLYARKDGAAFTGPVTVPTPAAGDNSQKAVNTAFLNAALRLDGIDPYNAATVYNSASPPVTSGNRIWQFINATPAAGQTPAENAYWTEVSPTVVFATAIETQAETLTSKVISPARLGGWFATKVLTGLAAFTNVSILATDTIMAALAKLQGQINARLGTALANGNLFVGSAGGVATGQAMSGDATIANNGVLTVGANKITNAKLAQMANLTVKGNNTGVTADPVDMPMLNIWEGVQSQFWDNERGLDRWARGTIFKQMADVTVANSTVEATLVSTTNQVGVNVLPAGALYVGDRVMLEASGIMSVANGTDTLNLKVKLGTLVISTIGATVLGTMANAGYFLKVFFTVRSVGATGTISASGFLQVDDIVLQLSSTTLYSLDTTASKVLDVTATWSNALAGNTITQQQLDLSIN